MTKSSPSSTSTVASGRSMRRWMRPFEASTPPSRIAKGMMASGFCRARNAIRMPGIAVAGGERGVGVPLDRRHLEHAGKAGEGAAERGEADDEALHRQPLQQRRADVAAGDAGGESPGGLFDQHPGEDAAQDAGHEAPVHVHARDVADAERVVDCGGRRLVQARRVAQRSLDDLVHQGDGDIGHQQAGDRLVHPAILPERADRADPDAADDRRGEPPSAAAR